MPGKKYRRCNKVDHDKILLMKTIKSRLIKISMKVDNYIYKQKTISGIKAKSFLDEISTYQTKCDGDAHCVQVIEKLTKFLNIVISNENSIEKNTINETPTSQEFREHEISNISIPINEVGNKQIDRNEYIIPNENNQCDFYNLSRNDILNSNINESNTKMLLEDAVLIEDTNNNVNKNPKILSTPTIEMNTFDITANNSEPLDLRKPINYSTTNRNWEIKANKTIMNSTPKSVIKEAEKTETAFITEVSQKFNDLKLNKEVINQEPNKHKTHIKHNKNEIINTKLNIIQEQPLKTMKVDTIQYIQPSYSCISKPQNKKSGTCKNDVLITELNPKEILHKNKAKFNDIYIQFCSQNDISKKDVNNVKKNITEKPISKRKIKKQLNVTEKVTKDNKKVKRMVNKAKNSESTEVKKSNVKHSVKIDNMKLDLSWFDTIKYIRQVDEKEYFSIKKSNEGF